MLFLTTGPRAWGVVRRLNKRPLFISDSDLGRVGKGSSYKLANDRASQRYLVAFCVTKRRRALTVMFRSTTTPTRPSGLGREFTTRSRMQSHHWRAVPLTVRYIDICCCRWHRVNKNERFAFRFPLTVGMLRTDQTGKHVPTTQQGHFTKHKRGTQPNKYECDGINLVPRLSGLHEVYRTTDCRGTLPLRTCPNRPSPLLKSYIVFEVRSSLPYHGVPVRDMGAKVKAAATSL